MCQTFLEHDKSSHPSVTVLKRVDSLEANMELKDVVKSDGSKTAVPREKLTNLFTDKLRWCRIHSANFIGYLLIFTGSEPRFATIAGSVLEKMVKFFNKRFG